MRNYYCEGSNCSKKNSCAKHVGQDPEKIYEFIDHSREGTGTFTDNGCVIVSHCGDDSTSYPYFEEYEQTNHEDIYLEEALLKFGVKTTYTNGKKKSDKVILAELLTKLHRKLFEK